MKVLLHTCCAPCLSGARIGFEDEGIPFSSFWYNPNIQPMSEHDRRLSVLLNYGKDDPFDLLEPDIGGRDEYSADIRRHSSGGYVTLMGVLEVTSRCDICYSLRLNRCALEAKARGYTAFSTSLLLSKYQKHDRIKAIGEVVADVIGIDFIYLDLRKYWGRSLDRSREYRLYRQRYCGCELSLSEASVQSPFRTRLGTTSDTDTTRLAG